MHEVLKALKISGIVFGGLASLFVLFALTALILLTTGVWQFRMGTGPPPRIEVELETTELALNKPFTLTTTLKPPENSAVSRVNAYLLLPSGAAYLDGFYEYHGPLKEELSFATSLVFVEKGDWELGLNVLPIGATSGVRRLYVEVAENAARLSRPGEKNTVMYRPHDLIGPQLYRRDPYLFAPRLYGHTISGGELLNGADQPFFSLIHDEAGRESMRQRGLMPDDLWGEWDQLYERNEGFAHADLNAAFLIVLADRMRPNTGYRAWIDRVEAGAQQIDIYGRFEPPPPGLPVAARPVSPYDIVLVDKEQWSPGQPVMVRFFLNDGLLREETIVIRKPYQGVDNRDQEGQERDQQSIREGIARISERFEIPPANLQHLASGGGDEYRSLRHLGIAVRRVVIRDTATGKRYNYEFDAYGREIEFDNFFAAEARTAQFLGSRRIEPTILRYGEEDTIQVQIWLLGGLPGETYKEVSAPLVAALTKLGIESEAEARLPRVKANLPKTIAIEIARREDVAFVALQPYAAPRAPEPAPAPTVRVAPELRAGVFLVPNVDAGGYAILNARIGPVKEAKSGAVYHLTEGIGAYEASLSYDPEGLTVTGLAHIEPFAYGVSNLNTQQGSRTNFVAFVAAAVGPVPPVTVADVRLRLKGNKNSAYTAQLQMGLISTAGGELISQESPARLTFVRGDADSSGTVTAKDAMAIAQFLAGSRAIGLETTMINPVNAASVHPDGPEGDRVDATDALYIAQMLVGLRNESFDLK